MRKVLRIAVIALIPNAAFAGDIIGLPEMQLMQCAGFPVGQMQFEDATLYQFSSMSERGTVMPFLQGGIFRRRAVGCEAVVTVQNGIVVAVEYKKSGGLITREIACGRLFANC